VRTAERIVEARVRSVAELREEIAPAPLVRGDPTRLLQVVVNVLLNAADACEASGLRGRSVHVALAADVRGDATLAISDNALGTTPADAERVFEPFFTTKEPGKGTGLGLALAKQIIADSGGHITFESAIGLGTTVRVVLPASRLR
jgi:two-component system, NtrC family, sensor kinase